MGARWGSEALCLAAERPIRYAAGRTVRLIAKLLILLSAALAAVPMSAAEDPTPLVVLIERNPWLMVIGADSPTFALYSDGLVVFRKADSSQYLSVRLDDDSQKDLIRKIAPGSVAELREFYAASQWSDQPTNELHVWSDGVRKTVSVYGSLRREETARAKSPKAFLDAFDVITRFSPDSSPWMPDQIEVLIWPSANSPEEPLPWPDGWPPFEKAKPMGAGGLHQVLLPASEFVRLEQLLKQLKPRKAVQFDGRKWAISYRLPFPGEDTWVR